MCHCAGCCQHFFLQAKYGYLDVPLITELSKIRRTQDCTFGQPPTDGSLGFVTNTVDSKVALFFTFY